MTSSVTQHTDCHAITCSLNVTRLPGTSVNVNSFIPIKTYHLTNSQEQYVQIRCIEFHENLLIIVQSEDGNLSTPVVK
jgi:hypothetical protein